MPASDTIAAVATAIGEAGVGIIRISGPDALGIARGIFKPSGKGGIEERRFHYGRIIEPRTNAALDDCLLVYMKGPRSFTGEDVVEIHCHGGALILRDVLALVLASGAREAGPGEFTKRAFLNDKMDLCQGEALLDLIRAGTGLALASARARLEGALSGKVVEIKDILTGLLVDIEAGLDFPEDVPLMPREKTIEALSLARDRIKELLGTYDHGRMLRDGVKTLILGRPNVGKSSLLNVLLKEERAIVTALPGTTRDIIEEAVNIKGVPIRLMDTAGLRDAADFIEAIGVGRAMERIKDADVILFVIDASAPGHGEDLGLLGSLAGKTVIVVANKSDLASDAEMQGIRGLFAGHEMVFVSALKTAGIEELERAIVGRPAPPGQDAGHALVASARHKAALENALEGLSRASDATGEGLPAEVVSSEIWWTLSRLGEITGETTPEDVLDRIFSEFCIGK